MFDGVRVFQAVGSTPDVGGRVPRISIACPPIGICPCKSNIAVGKIISTISILISVNDKHVNVALIITSS